MTPPIRNEPQEGSYEGQWIARGNALVHHGQFGYDADTASTQLQLYWDTTTGAGLCPKTLCLRGHQHHGDLLCL